MTPEPPSLTRSGIVITKDGTIVPANGHLSQEPSPASAGIPETNLFNLLPGRHRSFLKTMLNRADRCKSSQVSMRFDNSRPGDSEWEVIKLFAAGPAAPVYLCLVPLHDAAALGPSDASQSIKCKALDERAASGIIVEDENGGILWANQKSARLLGVPPNELFTPHFLEKLWKTYHHVHGSVPFEANSPSGSRRPGLLPSSATLVIKQVDRKYKTLSFELEEISRRNFSPSLVLVRIKEIMAGEAESSPVISNDSDWVWMRREYIEKTIAKAKEAERIRIGHELHDNINQMLAVIGVYLSLLHPADPDEKDLLGKSGHILKMAIEEIRCLSHGLVKDSTLREGFIAAVTALVDDFRQTRMFNISFTFNNQEVESMDQSKKVALYRILQEHLNNIVKYSQAKNVQICLDTDQKGVRLTIEDDGVGFNKLTVQKGIGLTGIYEKAELCNGSVELQTSPGHGCILKVTAMQGVSEN
ncbi:MAG TPA: ATP-binding protein [Puia sp.]|nr:ATP-binding protein [Puia sp.]